MRQERIKELLTEASSADCSQARLNKIQGELSQSTAAMRQEGALAGTYDTFSRAGGLDLVTNALFVETSQNRRDVLPHLLPVFSLLCGDRDSGIIAEIDWSLVDGSQQSPAPQPPQSPAV